MQIIKKSSQWWGPPRKFDRQEEERRVSWLELFFDLVYVIAISRITHHFAMHISVDAFLEYVFMFLLIFWGWLNGSLYHDLHGNEGLRTRLMTMWQMIIIAALAITIDQGNERRYHNMTMVLMIMQVYITYLWWAVGFYDRSHRRYNLPYTVFYLLGLALLTVSLLVPENLKLYILPLVIICNYLPPFIAQWLLRNDSHELNLSSSMFERLGLFGIIVFGELVLGVVNGFSQLPMLDFYTWLDFTLSIAIVFILWWIFFTLTANRQTRGGFLNATLLELLFIPALISLGLLAVSFSSFFDPHYDIVLMEHIFISAIAVLLIAISLMIGLLRYPDYLVPIRKKARMSLLVTAVLFFISSFINIQLESTWFMAAVMVILLLEITYLNSLYYGLNLED